ncbi:MAG: hypothetical protein INR71_08885, partial [Terriglobus roseus]|nr:hypothetical protein [Terriglobus roseus]
MAPIARVRKRRDDTHPPADRPLKKRRKETSHVSKKSELWEAREIIDESATHYLIEWEGLDSGTGKPYEPTWEPKSNANTPLRKSWALFKAGLKSSTKKKTLGDEHPEALSSSPPVQPPSGKQLRGLTFSHSQPTPDQTPDSSNTVAEWATRTASAAPAQTGSAPDRPSVAVVPSQRPFIPELYEALQTQLPEPPSSPYYTRRKRRLHLPEIPDSESSGDSSSYEPTAPSGSRAHATTQLSSSSSAPRLSSPIEEISQFRYSERQLEVESDPIADPISPITQGRRSKKVWAVVGSPLRKSVIAESTVTTGDAAAPPGVHLSGPYVIHSSASEQAESAPRTSGTAEIAQTIEQSPSASVALVEDRQSPDQADVSTEGEYSGSHAARHAKHRGQSRATGVLSEGSASFASRSPRTPPNAMNGQADDSPAGQSPPLTARSLQEKLAELDDVG